MDGVVLAFAIALSAFTTLLFGLAPSLSASKPDLVTVMKGAVAGSSSRFGLWRSPRGFLLNTLALGDPYSGDGSFAAKIRQLPPGLKAMAVTHWLDISLTLDSLTWHFGNFGEMGLVAETQAGLRELGLYELAECFAKARDLIAPLLGSRIEADKDLYQTLERAGLKEQAEELDRTAWALDDLGPDKSVIYFAWVRYTRQHPELVFGPTLP